MNPILIEVVAPTLSGLGLSCGGCNMKVALEIINALQSRDEIQTCSACGRLLYLED